MDQLQKSGGFAGRSELVRAAARLLIEDFKEKDLLSGHMNATVLVADDRWSRCVHLRKLTRRWRLLDVLRVFRGLCPHLRLDSPAKTRTVA